MVGCGSSLLHRQVHSAMEDATMMEGGAMNTCLRVLKETKWSPSF